MPLIVSVAHGITLENLTLMVENHIASYAFSNREYFGTVPDISYFPDHLFDKINKTKYGICMELNYAFSLFLTHRGYNNYLVKCHSPGSRSETRGIFHLSIIVTLMNNKYFVDVGFGDHFTKPILLSDKTSNKYYDLNAHNTILRIDDHPLTIHDLIENYDRLLRLKPGDIALKDILFERIYDRTQHQFVIWKQSKL